VISSLYSYLPGRRRHYTDVVGIDVGTTATRVVRVQNVGGTATLMAADLMPAFQLPAADAKGDFRPEPLILPKALRGVYAAVTINTPQVSIRLLTVPGTQEKVEQLNFPELLGVTDGAEYRIGYEILTAEMRGEQMVLATGVPETQARWAAALLPRGLPAPCSLQVAGVSALSGFGYDLTRRLGEGGALLVQIGTEVTNVAGFYKGRLALFRQCSIGSQVIVKGVRDRFGIEADLVPGILEDGMIDASEIVAGAIEPFLRQLVLAREFVERKRACRVEHVLLCGSLMGSRHWSTHIEQAMGIQANVWNPLAMLPVAPHALAKCVQGKECRFAAAVGAALAIMEIGG